MTVDNVAINFLPDYGLLPSSFFFCFFYILLFLLFLNIQSVKFELSKVKVDFLQ